VAERGRRGVTDIITSTANPRVQALRALHSPRGRAEAGLFLIEGPHLLDAALDASVLPALTLFAPEALERTAEGRRLLGRLAEARAAGAELIEATPAVIERAADTQAPQGIVASVSAAAVAPAAVRARRRGRARPLVLILDGLSDPGNLGTLLRSALASDVDEVWLAPGSADPLGPKAVRAGSGAHFHLPMHAGQAWDEIAARLGGAPAVRQVVLAEASAATAYDALDLTQRTALIVGNEAHGPSREAARLATMRVSIPMWNGVESLNAAIAASVICFEAGRQRRARQQTHPDPAPTE
jgi:TrmH family RNA methyltransferase